MDEQLFTKLANAAKQRLGNFNPQDLYNTAWAFAAADYVHEQLFTELANAAKQRLGNFNPQDLANTASAFAIVGHKDEQMFAALIAAAQQRIGNFNVQDLTNTVWAFAMVDHWDEQLFAALAAAKHSGNCCEHILQPPQQSLGVFENNRKTKFNQTSKEIDTDATAAGVASDTVPGFTIVSSGSWMVFVCTICDFFFREGFFHSKTIYLVQTSAYNMKK